MLQDMKPCNRCKVNLPMCKFTEKSSGELNKWCDRCLATQNKKRKKCPHGKYKFSCLNPDCNDPVKVTITKWLHSTRQADKNSGLYDMNNHIHRDFLNGLVADYPECKWCDVKVQYSEYNKTKATIERLKNTIGHICSNCVIACRDCNLTRVANLYDSNGDLLPEKKNKTRSQKYRLKNRDQILSKMREKVTCECGCVSTRGSLRPHRKSKKHLKFIEEKNTIDQLVLKTEKIEIE